MLFSSFSTIAFATLAAAQVVRNKGNGVEFLFPNQDGLSVNYLDTVNITYTSPFANPLLYTFCYNVSNHKQSIQTSIITANPYNSSHLYTLNYKDVSGCYWNLRPNTSTGYGANSYDILIIADGQKSSTTVGLAAVLPSETGTSTGTSATSIATGGAANTNTTSDTQSQNEAGGESSKLSTGAKAGIGIGAAVLAIAAIAALAFFLLKRRKGTAKNVDDDEGSASASASDAYGYQHVRPDDSAYASQAVRMQEAGSGKPEEKVEELPGAVGGGVVREMNNEKVVELPGNGDRQVYEMGTGEEVRR